MSEFLYRHIQEASRKNPEHPAIVDGGCTLTYRELLEKVERFASSLSRLDLRSDSKIGILCVNQKEYLIGYIAALTIGLPAIPMNCMLAPETLAYIAKDSRIDVLLVDSIFLKAETAPFFKSFPHKILIGEGDIGMLGAGAHRFEEFLEQAGSSPENFKKHQRTEGIPDAILYTSGTTAMPKGVMLNETQFESNAEQVIVQLDFTSQDRVIVALPLFHSFGNMMAWVVLKAGGTLILVRQFAPKTILAQVTESKATILPLAPTLYSFMAELYARGGWDVSSLRFCISGGAALPTSLLAKVKEVMGVSVLEGYGLTETSPVIAVNTIREGNVPGSVGPVLPNLQIKITDESGAEVSQGEVGEIQVKGETVTQGYWNLPKETGEAIDPDGWFKTGDLGHQDEKGRLYISAGRKKDLIIRAGENISPLAVENALLNHPGILEAAVVGVADERAGERVKACIVKKPDAEISENEVKEFCRKNLAAFMVPDNIRFYDELPKNATGKIVKTQLRDDEE